MAERVFAVAPEKTPKWLLDVKGVGAGTYVQIEPPADEAPEELGARWAAVSPDGWGKKETSEQLRDVDGLWQEIAKRLTEDDGVEQIYRYVDQGNNVWRESLRHIQVMKDDQAVGWFDLDGGLVQYATLYDVGYIEQPMINLDGRKLFLMTDEMWESRKYPPEVGSRTTSKEADRVGRMKRRAGEKPASSKKANDYVDVDAAIESAQTKFGATHLQRDGRGASIFTPTGDGSYEKRTAFVEKGFTHWPEKGILVERLPNGAVEFDEVVFDPDAPPRRVPVPPISHRRAADRHRRQASESRQKSREEHRGGFHLVLVPANQSWMIFMGHGQPSTWSRIAGPTDYDAMKRKFDAILSEERQLGGEESKKASEAAACACHAKEDKRATAKENPVVVSDGIPWVKSERNPDEFREVAEIAKKHGTFDDPKQVYELLSPYLMKQDQECFIVVLLDVHSKLRGVSEIHRGARESVNVSPADVMKVVLDRGASGFLIAHNHPSGDCTPSDSDADLTEAFKEVTKPYEPDVVFLDHIVCGSGEFYSFTSGKKFKVT